MMKTRKCPACRKVRTYRDDVKTCGCQGTNPRLVAAAPAAPAEVSAPKVQLNSQQLANIELEKLRTKRESKDGQLSVLKDTVLRLEQELETVNFFRTHTPQAIEIAPALSRGGSESAAVTVWSDHHSEERVTAGHTSGKNVYNLEINQSRFDQLVHGTLAWFRIEDAKTKITSLTVALLGDFITGNIHADLAEGNFLPMTEAIYRVQNQLLGGLRFLAASLPKDVKIIVVCHGGNHGRMTKEQRIATETGNSLEQYMYYVIRDFFKDDKRFQFIVAEGYHSYVTYFDKYIVRYHHGHEMNYGGGVGGITIPVNKAIAQWNRSKRVDLDVFGHFHTRFDGGNFICNGSLIGYNAFAVAIKASFEKPSQTFFLINKEYGEKTMVAPIFVD